MVELEDDNLEAVSGGKMLFDKGKTTGNNGPEGVKAGLFHNPDGKQLPGESGHAYPIPVTEI